MKLSEIKKHLNQLETIGFQLPNGKLVPSHFHVTEVGKVSKHFIDCGGTVRNEEVINFQLWEENDYNHRLHPEKLLKIIELSERTLGIEDVEIEVEYQGETIGKYALDFDGTNFLMVTKSTTCLAREDCGVPAPKSEKKVSEAYSKSSCTPQTSCC